MKYACLFLVLALASVANADMITVQSLPANLSAAESDPSSMSGVYLNIDSFTNMQPINIDLHNIRWWGYGDTTDNFTVGFYRAFSGFVQDGNTYIITANNDNNFIYDLSGVAKVGTGNFIDSNEIFEYSATLGGNDSLLAHQNYMLSIFNTSNNWYWVESEPQPSYNWRYTRTSLAHTSWLQEGDRQLAFSLNDGVGDASSPVPEPTAMAMSLIAMGTLCCGIFRSRLSRKRRD